MNQLNKGRQQYDDGLIGKEELDRIKKAYEEAVSLSTDLISRKKINFTHYKDWCRSTTFTAPGSDVENTTSKFDVVKKTYFESKFPYLYLNFLSSYSEVFHGTLMWLIAIWVVIVLANLQTDATGRRKIINWIDRKEKGNKI